MMSPHAAHCEAFILLLVAQRDELGVSLFAASAPARLLWLLLLLSPVCAEGATGSAAVDGAGVERVLTLVDEAVEARRPSSMYASTFATRRSGSSRREK